jgi:hypothetical protein
MIEYIYSEQEMRAYDEQKEQEKLSKVSQSPPTRGKHRPSNSNLKR